MNIKNEIGSIFYRVEYYGVLSKLEIIGYKNNVPIYRITPLSDLRNDKWALIEKPTPFSTSNYPLSIVLEKTEEYFDDFEKAKQKALDKFEKEVNPNGKYRVAKYFDDVFEKYVTDILTKKEATDKANELNSKPRYYVSYGIRTVKKAVEENC